MADAAALSNQTATWARLAYTDVGALKGLRGDDRATLEQAVTQFESLFIDIWLASMRDAGKVFGEGNYLSSTTVEMHQEMLDHQWASHIAQAGGLGLRDVLLRQLAPDSAPDASAEAGGLPAPSRSVAAVPPVAASSDTPPRNGFKAPLFDGVEDFVRKLEPVVRDVAAASGLHPIAMLAQAALETGWGSHVAHDASGRPSFNLFGIKAHDWQGPAVRVPTLEHRADRYVRQVDSFRAYSDIAEAIDDYAAFLGSNSRYAQALEVAQDPAAFADELQKAGYATDPDYAAKLKALQRRIVGLLGGE